MSYAAPPRRARSLTLALASILFLLFAVADGASAAVQPQSVDFTTSGLARFDQLNESVGSLRVVDGGYGDDKAARAVYSGGGENGFARGIFNVNWDAGEDVWYSGAYFLPRGFKAAMQGQVAILRWDDYGSHPNSADHGGIVINGGDRRARLAMDKLGPGTQDELGEPFDLPEGRWFHLEVHQRLSSSRSAVNEVYLDGARVSVSNIPNLEPGRGVDRVRYGIVAIASGSQTRSLDLKFDNATVATSKVGPNPGLTQPAEPATPTKSGSGRRNGTIRTARYTRRVKKCMRRALVRAARSGDAGFLPRAARRCVAKYAVHRRVHRKRR